MGVTDTRFKKKVRMRIGALVKYICNVTSLRDLIKLQSCCFIVDVVIAHICLNDLGKNCFYPARDRSWSTCEKLYLNKNVGETRRYVCETPILPWHYYGMLHGRYHDRARCDCHTYQGTISNRKEIERTGETRDWDSKNSLLYVFAVLR